MNRTTLKLFVFGALTFVASSAAAEAPKPRVVVYTTGGVGQPVEDLAVEALGEDVIVENRDQLTSKWASLGNAGKPHLDAPDAKRREALLEALRGSASAAHLDAVVFVMPQKHGKSRGARVVVLGAQSSTPLADSYVPLGAHPRADSMKRVIGDAMSLVASAERQPEPEKQEASAADASGDATAPDGAAAGSSSAPDRDVASAPAAPAPQGSIVDASYAMELGGRGFQYNDRYTNNLRSYSVIGAPLGALDVDFAPFAHSGVPVASQLGIDGGYASSFELSSEVNGTRLSTSWYRFYVGPRYRLPLGTSTPTAIDLAVVYGGETFGFQDAPTALAPQLPDVAYRYVRPSLGARVTLGRATLKASFAYMDVLSAGAVAQRFGGASVAGIDAEIGGAYAIGSGGLDGLEIRANAGYRRFFYSFHPQPGDAYAAGGALDQFADAQLAIALVK